MKPPSILVRVAGSPVAAIPLTLWGVWWIFLWAQGRGSVLLALIGFFVVVRTISCVRQRRRYKAWRKEWESVETTSPAPVRRQKRLRVATVVAAVLFVGLIVCGPHVTDNPDLNNALVWLWLLCGIFLVARLLIGIGRLVMKRRNQNAERAKRDAAPVSWMLSTTVDSPSRQMAVRSLPEYAARILNQ